MNFLPIDSHCIGSTEAELEIICDRILDYSLGLPVGIIFYFVLTEVGSYLPISATLALNDKQELKAKLRKLMESPQFYCFAVSDTGLALIKNTRITSDYTMELPVEIEQPTVDLAYATGLTQTIFINYER